MFRNNKEFSDKYFPILEKTFGFAKRVQISQVDFGKSWTKVVFDQKWRLGFSLMSEVLIRIYMTLMTIFVGWIFATQNYSWFYGLCWGYFGVLMLSTLSMYNYCILVSNMMESVMYNAVKFFLVVDPMFHSTRSSGQIIAKVNRGSESFENLLDGLTFDIVGAVVGILSVVVAMIVIDFRAGVLAGAFVLLIAALSFASQVMAIQVTAPKWIGADDKLKSTNVETLQQVAHIRSSFASNEQLQKVENLVKKLATTLATSWYSGLFSSTLVRAVFAISFVVVGSQIISSIQSGQLSAAVGIALLGTYLNGASQIVSIGRSIERLTDRISTIDDLFVFIRSFGKQTYPVLEDDK
jgi:ABC-type multidrug transport system fused ATPase/permease subunit